MHPLFLALYLFTAEPTTENIVTTSPTHYISNVGYEDLTHSTLPDAALTWPTIATKLTRGFKVGGHTGLDIDGKTGDAVYAAFTGTVTTVSHAGPYGNKIVISHPGHPEKISTLYAHLTDTSVSVGDEVAVGQVIGTVGATGNADGDHLHFEVLLNGTAVDPLSYF
jgi:murein DD-endopeptidase MepM/ murein hydrolase activator NlpD